MPTKLTRTKWAALSHTVKSVERPPTVPAWTNAALWPAPVIPHSASIHILSSGRSGPRRLDADDLAFGPENRGNAYLRQGARFSQKSTFTASAGQPVPLGDLTHFRGA